MEILKCCPFCGKVPQFKFLKLDNEHNILFTIQCSKCEVHLQKVYKIDWYFGFDGDIHTTINQKDKAIQDWNRRFN